jgi:ABC-type dipeptide/oligopeptide/nickel transport system ATPase component
MASVPRLDKKWGKVEVDLKAKHSGLSGGCVYYERCSLPAKDEGCARDRPALIEIERDHFVACSRL